MSPSSTQNLPYQLVQLATGEWSVRCLQHGETFHPVIGPVAEAEALYVRQLKLRQRVQETASDQFVVWDVGLGAAANPITLLNGLKGLRTPIRIVSFDHTLDPLRFALEHKDRLTYLLGYEQPLMQLLHTAKTEFQTPGGLPVHWCVEEGDFPTLLHSPQARTWPQPHVILFDAYSPAKNPIMWSFPVFSTIFRLLDPHRPCSLPTYSRSTLLRVTLLLAGFYVGAGHATGEKEETTIAANHLSLLEEPLGTNWLKRARNSTSAEPLWDGHYRQAPLTEQTWQKLLLHPQFASVQDA